MTDNKSKGIYHKFNVSRTDGSDQLGRKHDSCDYFVLDITHDVYAANALAAYADACEADYPKMAQDIRARLKLDNNNKN